MLNVGEWLLLLVVMFMGFAFVDAKLAIMIFGIAIMGIGSIMMFIGLISLLMYILRK